MKAPILPIGNGLDVMDCHSVAALAGLLVPQRAFCFHPFDSEGSLFITVGMTSTARCSMKSYAVFNLFRQAGQPGTVTRGESSSNVCKSSRRISVCNALISSDFFIGQVFGFRIGIGFFRRFHSASASASWITNSSRGDWP
jgi:hypothetical protein